MQSSAFWTLKLSKYHAEKMQPNAEILKKTNSQTKGGGGGWGGGAGALAEKLATIT